MPSNETIKLKKDLEAAMRHWSANIADMCKQHYGKDKVGHILILFPFGSATSVSWISDARSHSVVTMLRELADHIESPNAKIIRPN